MHHRQIKSSKSVHNKTGKLIQSFRKSCLIVAIAFRVKLLTMMRLALLQRLGGSTVHYDIVNGD